MADSTLINSGDYSNSLNREVFGEIHEGSKCLDVGCWTGNLGNALIKEKKCVVDGIDVKVDVLNKAKKNGYRNTYLINFNNEQVDFKQLKQKYDVIIFADILEHLVNPDFVLKSLINNLTLGGKIIISLPNVAFLLNRILLLFGSWNYREFGTLDKTHLRFYTISSLKRMVANTGLEIEAVKPYNQFGILRYIDPLTAIFPTFLAYQIMIVAKKNK
jgi:2-polyprenyl-3-methyl-5-hydroxy-6-metoxy-1,4-benzoquinol methylase